MTNRRIHKALLPLAVLASLTLIFLVSCQTPSNLRADKLPTVQYSGFLVADPAYVALKQGFFTNRGIDVQFVENSGGTTGLQAVAAGRIEAGGAPIPSLISAVASGLQVIGVSDFQSAVPGFPVEEFFVRPDSGIRSISDLKGRKVAVNSVGGSFQYTIFLALEQARLSKDDVEFVVLPFDKQVPALVSGNVAMIGLIPPFSTKALALFPNDIKPFFNALDVFGAKQFVVHAINKDWAKKNPQLASAFVGGIADATEWISTHPDETKKLMAEYTHLEAEYMPVFHFQAHGQVVLEDVQFWIDFLHRYGGLTGDIRPEQVVTNEYNPYLGSK